MSEEQSDKLKLNLKATDTNRFKIEAEPTASAEKTEAPIPETGAQTQKIDDLGAQRKVNTGSFKRVDVAGQAAASATVPGLGEGGLKKSETVRLKVVRATPAGAPPAGGATASTVKVNLKRPDETAPAAASTVHTSTLKLRPTTPAAAPEQTAATEPPSAATVKVSMPTMAPAAEVQPKKEEATATEAPKSAEEAAPAAEGSKPALKLNKPKKEAAATVAVEPPPEAKPAEEKKEEPKPAMKMKGTAYTKEDEVEKYLPQRDDDEPGALEGVAALIAFLGTGFATYQLVMNFLQQIQ